MTKDTFEFEVDGKTVTVYFHGYIATATCNDNDEFDLLHGISLALLRAAKKNVLGRGNVNHDRVLRSFAEITGLKRFLAEFIAFTAYHRGRADGMVFIGSIQKGLKQSLCRHRAHIEDEFVRINKKRLGEAITFIPLQHNETVARLDVGGSVSSGILQYYRTD